MDGFRRLQDETGIHQGEIAGLPERGDGAGMVFVLTSSGLRHIGLRPGSARTNATSRGFLGYLQEELFWKDAFELVHREDLPLLAFLVSLVMEEPGASESAEVRFRDAGGEWASYGCLCTERARGPGRLEHATPFGLRLSARSSLRLSLVGISASQPLPL
jgi:hypothetical protein